MTDDVLDWSRSLAHAHCVLGHRPTTSILVPGHVDFGIPTTSISVPGHVDSGGPTMLVLVSPPRPWWCPCANRCGLRPND